MKSRKLEYDPYVPHGYSRCYQLTLAQLLTFIANKYGRARCFFCKRGLLRADSKLVDYVFYTSVNMNSR